MIQIAYGLKPEEFQLLTGISSLSDIGVKFEPEEKEFGFGFKYVGFLIKRSSMEDFFLELSDTDLDICKSRAKMWFKDKFGIYVEPKLIISKDSDY